MLIRFYCARHVMGMLMALPGALVKIKYDGIASGLDECHESPNQNAASEKVGNGKCDAEMQHGKRHGFNHGVVLSNNEAMI